MKNKEEPSSDLSRRNPARPVQQYHFADPGPATLDSTSRPGLVNDHIGIRRLAIHQVIVTDKPCTTFKH